MSLKEDVNAGLLAISNPQSSNKLVLDQKNSCVIPILMPPSVIKLSDGQMQIKVQMSRTVNSFTLISPLASIKATPSQAFFETLFYRQYYADQVSGISLAVNFENNVLVAVYHWILDTITPNQFSALFMKFVDAVFDMIREIGTMAGKERNVQPIHPE